VTRTEIDQSTTITIIATMNGVIPPGRESNSMDEIAVHDARMRIHIDTSAHVTHLIILMV
jgi:hypothetical protein